MATKNGEFLKKLLATFKLEAAEHVQALTSGLIQLERAAPGEQAKIIETVFREAHSLKGAARAVGFAEIESICQSAESVFSALTRGKLDLEPTLLDTLHDAIDALGKLLAAVESKTPGAPKPSVAEVVARLETALKGVPVRSAHGGAKRGTADRAAQEPREPSAPPEKPVLADTVRIATARLDSLLRVAEELLGAKLTARQRSAEAREAARALAAFRKERSKLVAEFKAPQQGVSPSAPGGTADPQLRKLAEFLDWENAQAASFEAHLAALAQSAERDQRSLGALVDGLLDDMKKALMLPVASALEVFPKFVRDLSRDKNKEAELLVRGAEIEIDRRILEEMHDPLIHLLRNCVDHGIEAPEERGRKGKPPRGTITLAVSRRNGSSAEILVRDDGAGVDANRVLDAALKIGAVAREDAAGRDERALLRLIFRSGVSTSPIITDVSGRGLGLAIVREKVERLGGTVTVETEPGRGTTFRVIVPLTLATFRGIQVRTAGELFVVPTTYVEQATRVDKGEIRTVENRETVRWNGQAVSLVRLADALELPRKSSAERPAETVQVLVISAADRRIAFLVDEVLEEREILVKPLGKQLARVRNVGGATVLGTGKAIPILDVPDLLKSAVKAAAAPVAATAARTAEEIAAQKSLLVVEDSITARTLLRSILESAGYRVRTALDGIDALTQLKTEAVDLVVSDVDMPRMNGFDLTARIRADKALGALPVVLVTALESREDRERGIDAGANAYIVKSSFDQSNLLEVIKRLA